MNAERSEQPATKWQPCEQEGKAGPEEIEVIKKGNLRGHGEYCCIARLWS